MSFSISDGDQSAISIKTVILGEPGVGKTCIANRLVMNIYKECEPTTGASYAQKIIFYESYNRSLKFDIWDTAGQEKYRSMNKIFYKDARVAVLVYDITRQSSFDEIKNYWVNQIKENAKENIILAIAANKADLYEHEEVDEGLGRKFAEDIGAIFMYTSAKNSSGIDELFKKIGDNYFNPLNNDNNTNNINKERSKNDNNTLKLDSKLDNKKSGKSGCC